MSMVAETPEELEASEEAAVAEEAAAFVSVTADQSAETSSRSAATSAGSVGAAKLLLIGRCLSVSVYAVIDRRTLSAACIVVLFLWARNS